MKIDLLGTKITPILSSELPDILKTMFGSSGASSIYKINTEFILRANRDKKFQSILNKGTSTIVDGRGVLWIARYLSMPIERKHNLFITTIIAIWQMVYSGMAIIFNPKFINTPIKENIPGVDAFKLMLKVAEETDSSVFLFGATQSDLDGAIKNIKIEFPKLIISGSLNGYEWQKNKNINPINIINSTNAKLLIVALGSPLQEYWIEENISKLKNVRVAVGEGGTLAFISGTFKRAPKMVQKIGLEWLWRLFANRSLTHQTGSRLKRVWEAVPVTIYEVVKYKIERIKNEKN